jgi:hypothetical protein
VLTLDANGIPHRWVSWQHAVFYQAKDLVAWVAGSHEFEIRGGINRVTGEQSSIRTNSIIAIKGRSHAHKLQTAVPPSTTANCSIATAPSAPTAAAISPTRS